MEPGHVSELTHVTNFHGECSRKADLEWTQKCIMNPTCPVSSAYFFRWLTTHPLAFLQPTPLRLDWAGHVQFCINATERPQYYNIYQIVWKRCRCVLINGIQISKYSEEGQSSVRQLTFQLIGTTGGKMFLWLVTWSWEVKVFPPFGVLCGYSNNVLEKEIPNRDNGSFLEAESLWTLLANTWECISPDKNVLPNHNTGIRIRH